MMLSIFLLKAAVVCMVLACVMIGLGGIFSSFIDGHDGKIAEATMVVIISVLLAAIILAALLLVGAFGAHVFDVRV